MFEPTISVNFTRPIAIFPLADRVLLPHETFRLHIFEPRYRQLVSHCLDREGQFAMATTKWTPWRRRSLAPEQKRTPSPAETGEPVPLRSAVCVGQVIHHDALPDGRFLLLLHGVQRATICDLHDPDDDRAYRTARLAPLEPLDDPSPPMEREREHLRVALTDPRLEQLEGLDTMLEWVDHEDIPTRALIELIGFRTVTDAELKYRILAESDPQRRATMVTTQLDALASIAKRAARQSHREWPKGMSWN